MARTLRALGAVLIVALACVVVLACDTSKATRADRPSMPVPAHPVCVASVRVRRSMWADVKECEVNRVVDWEAGVVCYMYGDSGISCLPLETVWLKR